MEIVRGTWTEIWGHSSEVRITLPKLWGVRMLEVFPSCSDGFSEISGIFPGSSRNFPESLRDIL